tara:strand:+ start:1305 stop:1808 length:504 start_codon:yes stop_codon:yes gene_type:complete
MNTQNIGDIIRQLAKQEEEIYSLPCKVVSISNDLAELQPLNGDPNLLGVKLISGAADFPLKITPIIDSVVIATFLSKDTAFISLYSEVQNVEIRGDQYGGIVKAEELINNLAKLTARVDGIISAINNGVAVPQDGGTALQTTIKAALATLVDKENFSTIKNENVTHG